MYVGSVRSTENFRVCLCGYYWNPRTKSLPNRSWWIFHSDCFNINYWDRPKNEIPKRSLYGSLVVQFQRSLRTSLRRSLRRSSPKWFLKWSPKYIFWRWVMKLCGGSLRRWSPKWCLKWCPKWQFGDHFRNHFGDDLQSDVWSYLWNCTTKLPYLLVCSANFAHLLDKTSKLIVTVNVDEGKETFVLEPW